jgi:hypothetical protein
MAKAGKNDKIIIPTPRGQVFTHIIQSGKNKGKIVARIEWNKDFGAKWTGQFSRAQKFLDSEVLRDSTPLVPFRTGALARSGQLGTVIGSGMVSWVAPYAKFQYYNTAETRGYDAQRGGKWFERAKASHKPAWVAGVKKIAGGK